MALEKVAGIDIFADKKTNQLKDMPALIEELAVKWKDFDDVQKAGISEAIAGKQQAAVFQSLMANFDIMKNIQDELGNGSHWQSMEKENAQYVDSLAGQLNKLKETWVGIFNTIFSSDATKSIIKGLVSISEAIATVVTKLDDVGMLTPMLAVLGATLTGKVFKGFLGFNSALTSVVGATQGVATTVPLMTRVLGLFGVGSTTAATATGGLAAGLSTLMPWVVGTTVAVGAAAVAYDYFNESLDEEKERLENTVKARKDEISGLEEQRKSLGNIADEYDELSKKPNKTNKEVERLKELTNDIAKVMPDLIIGYDENGNAILNMTGDVSELVKELDDAIERKNRLLKHEQGDLAENSINQLFGNYDGSIKGMQSVNESEMGKLEKLTSDHVDNMSKLEKKREDLLNSLYGKSAEEKKKTLKQIEDLDYQIEKKQSDFVQDYTYQLDIIKEYTDKVGEGLFAGIENSNSFKNATDDKKKHFLELKEVLDFSDIKTEEQLYDVERALTKFLQVANNGDIDIKGLETSIREINNEFDRTGNIDTYNASMEQLAKQIAEVSGIDANILMDLFTQFDTSVLKGKDALDEFLRAYGKTKEDLLGGNGFAEALANQKQAIDDWITSLGDAGVDATVDVEMILDLYSDEDIPQQVRDLVRSLYEQGYDTTDILEVAQQVLIDMSDGEVDLDSLQALIDSAFGEGAFELTPELLLNPKAEIAGVEDVVSKLKEKYDEIPDEIETAIRVDSVTSYIEAERILSMYNGFPDEVKTVISSNGFETVKDLELINELFINLPPEQAMQIITNYSDVIKDSENLEGILAGLSKTPLNIEATVNADDAVNKVNELVNTPIKDKILALKGDNTDANKKAEEVDTKVNDIKQDKPTKIEVDNISANNRLKTTRNHLAEIKSKSVTVTVNTVERKSTVNVSGNQSTLGTYGSQFVDSQITDGNEIALLSETQQALSSPVTREGLGDIPSVMNYSRPLDVIDKGYNYFIELENQLKKINNQLEILDTKMENAVGREKINYLQQQVVLYREQQKVQQNLINDMSRYQSSLKGFLGGKGFKFDGDGNLTNYHEKLIAMEKELDRLENIANKTNASDKQKDAASKYKEQLEQIKKVMSEYIDVTFTDLPKAKEEWEDLNNTIKDTSDAIEELNRKQKLFIHENRVKELEYEYDKIADKLDILDEKLKNAYGKDKLDLMDQQIELMRQQQQIQQDLINSYQKQADIYKSDLANYGFEFDKNGDITNLDENLNKFKDSKDLEKVTKLLEDYIKIQRDELPDATKEWEGLENSIKDVYKEQLNITKEIEDKITEIYKKQVEDRKKLIQEELDNRLDALDKEKEAYNNARKEVDYQRDYDDQLDVIKDLEKKLTIASKDTSLSGQKKVQELLKQLKEEQLKLEDLVQNKIDDQVNDMFDKESERLEQEAENKVTDLEDKYSDSNLQQIVKDALTNGVFVDIDGNMKDLQSSLLEFEDAFGDGMSAVGQLIKNEMIANLEIARDTIKDLSSVMSGLNLDNLSSSVGRMLTVDIAKSSPSYQASNNQAIQFNSPLMIVEGNITEDVLPQVKDMIDKVKDEVAKQIVNYIK